MNPTLAQIFSARKKFFQERFSISRIRRPMTALLFDRHRSKNTFIKHFALVRFSLSHPKKLCYSPFMFLLTHMTETPFNNACCCMCPCRFVGSVESEAIPI
jgi:hypothetical protein